MVPEESRIEYVRYMLDVRQRERSNLYPTLFVFYQLQAKFLIKIYDDSQVSKFEHFKRY